ncbi:MAG: hypothetical protein HYS26_02820 [Candidatus Kaiserbacteria bacterium]|nr:MAG: hypothetical protein HYS26_02820 [Candidatus Kaiserbacteria bacterium]
MSKPTLTQALSLLHRVDDKKLSLKRLEEHFDAGLISDLLDVDPRTVVREEFRRVIGHPAALPASSGGPLPEPTIVELGEFEVNYDETIASKLAGNADPGRINPHNEMWAPVEKFADPREGKKRFKASAINFGEPMLDQDVERWCEINKKVQAAPKEGIDIALASPRPKLDNVMPLVLSGKPSVSGSGCRSVLFFCLEGEARDLGVILLAPTQPWIGHQWLLVLEEIPEGPVHEEVPEGLVFRAF